LPPQINDDQPKQNTRSPHNNLPLNRKDIACCKRQEGNQNQNQNHAVASSFVCFTVQYFAQPHHKRCTPYPTF
jgi:hypothetical protein